MREDYIVWGNDWCVVNDVDCRAMIHLRFRNAEDQFLMGYLK
jgi:hypothetical protein